MKSSEFCKNPFALCRHRKNSMATCAYTGQKNGRNPVKAYGIRKSTDGIHAAVSISQQKKQCFLGVCCQ